MEHNDITEEYFNSRSNCRSISCRKVIFEPDTKREWFFEDDFWCYFEFLCDDNDYVLKKQDEKIFSNNCILKDMSYEIKMLLAYVRLKGVVTIEQELFTRYVFRYEREKKSEPDLTLEKFNLNLKKSEEDALSRSDKIANGILAGCLTLIGFTVFLFLFALIAYFKSKI